MQWTKKDIRVFPWDLPITIEHRIKSEHGPLVDIRKKGEDYEILDWEEELNSFSVRTPLSDVLHEFPKEKAKQVLKKHLQRLWYANELSPEQWEELFRYEMQWKDMDYENFQEQMKKEKVEFDQLELEAKKFLKISRQLEKLKPYPTRKWTAGLHKLRFDCVDIRSLGNLFHDLDLPLDSSFLMAILKQGTQTISKTARKQDPELMSLLEEDSLFNLTKNGIYLWSREKDLVFIEKEKPTHITIELQFSNTTFLEETFSCLHIQQQQIEKKTDIGLLGQFLLPDMFLEYPLFQDVCLNDPLLSTFLRIDESRKPSFEATLWVMFTPFFQELLTVEKQPFHITLKNLHRQTGFQTDVTLTSPIPEPKIDFFLDLFGRLMERFVEKHDELLKEYEDLLPSEIPSVFEKQKKAITKNIKKKRPDYFTKYPRMFVKKVYSTNCQKKQQPTLITEEEASEIDPERYILFPPEPMGEFEPEYYHCPSEEFPNAGLKKMKGKDVGINFAPCCFKSPQESTYLKYFEKLRLMDGTEEEEEEEEETPHGGKKTYTNIINKDAIIHHPGQLGYLIPKSLIQFFNIYDPNYEYLRIGVERDQNSLLHCMIMRNANMGFEVETPDQIRYNMRGNNNIIQSCVQENPGLSLEEIQKDLGDDTLYFDPCRFIRAVELYYGVQLIIFTRGLKESDVSVFLPRALRSPCEFRKTPPFVMIYQHYGGRTDMMTDTPYPHCELITYRKSNKDPFLFNFDYKKVMNVLNQVHYLFDGKNPLKPFPRTSPLLRYLKGQSLDGLNKVRMLYFEFEGNVYSGKVDPMPFFSNIKLIPPTNLEIDAEVALPFLKIWKKWSRLQLCNLDSRIVYWTVSDLGLEVTFTIRLPNPRPQEIGLALQFPKIPFRLDPKGGLELIQNGVFPKEILNEKKVRCIDWLTRHLFSYFLREQDIPKKALDPDILLDHFQKIHVLFVDEPLDFSQMNRLENFIQNQKIKIPSLPLWKKIKYNLKWHLFYKREELESFSDTDPRQVFFQNLSDFIYSDVQHYYCLLSQLKTVMKNSVEQRYDLNQESLENVKENGLWYNPKQSPFPFPSLVLKFPSLEHAMTASDWYYLEGYIPETIKLGDKDFVNLSQYNWDPIQEKWIWQKGEGQKIFTFAREKDCLVCLQPNL